jgi:glutathione S-transferase
MVLDRQPFVAGDRPAYADYILFGVFQWARLTSSYALLADDDPIFGWRTRMLDLFDGLAAKAKGFPL